jgi:hypothetical protein
MKYFALTLFVITILILSFIFNHLSLKEINSKKDLENLNDNEKIITSGLVMEEKKFGKNSLLILDNELEIICKCNRYYLNKKVRIEGYKDSLTKKIIALEIR